MKRAFAVLLAGLAAWPAGGGVAAGAAACVPVPVVDDRCETWATAQGDPGGRGRFVEDTLTDMALAPQGDRIFLVGETDGKSSSDRDAGVVAVVAATGARLWSTGFGGPAGRMDTATSVAVAPDGSRVYVAGAVDARGTTFTNVREDGDILVLAYAAATGTHLWTATYDGPGVWKEANGGGDHDSAADIAVSPDGSRVFVTGSSLGLDGRSDHATMALDASTGEEVWVARFDRGSSEEPEAIALSPDGARVYVAGQSGYGAEYAVVAYDVGEPDGEGGGETAWVHRYRISAWVGWQGVALAAGPEGSRVYVTGNRLTAALDAGTGKRLWSAPFQGSLDLRFGEALAPAPDGSRLFVTGFAAAPYGEIISSQPATVAFDAATGATLWTALYPRSWTGQAVAVRPDGSRVYVAVAGRATIAYDAATGAQAWAARHGDLPTERDPSFASVAVSPDGGMVYSAGTSFDFLDTEDTGGDFQVLAYEG